MPHRREMYVTIAAKNCEIRRDLIDWLVDQPAPVKPLRIPRIATVPIHGEPDVQCPDCGTMHYGSGHSTICRNCR
jgi:hypothetical protein